MKFVKNLLLGYKNYINAFGFIKEHKMWKYFLVPLILFGIIFYVGFYFQDLKEETEQLLQNEGNGFFQNIWLNIKVFFQWLISWFFIDATRYVVMIVLSPLIASLSERTERILTGNKYKFNLKQLIKDVKRGIGIAIRMLIAEMVLVYVIWWPIWAILGLSDSTFFTVQVLVGFYFYGFGFIDYINERLRLTISQSWKFMKKHAGLAIAIGSVFSLLFYIPSTFDLENRWLNVVISNIGVIFAPVLAVIAATLSMHELVDLSKNRYAEKEKK